jgi:adenylate kinase
MYKYIIMGIQGCGKGTQAKLLCDNYDFVHISIGDIFRWHIANHTKLAAKINRIISKGQMVGDDLVAKVVSERLTWHNWNYGFVLDGFPRNFAQAEFLFENYNINAVIHMDAPDSLVTERVLARRVCSKCGLDYNLIGHRPKKEGVCDVCGGSLAQRSDDHPEAIQKRLEDYHVKTEPMLAFFRRIGILHSVDATLTIPQVFEDIRKSLNLPEQARPLNSNTLSSDTVGIGQIDTGPGFPAGGGGGG